MESKQDRYKWTTREIVFLTIAIIFAILTVVFGFLYVNNNNVNKNTISINQYNALLSNYTSLQEQYNAILQGMQGGLGSSTLIQPGYMDALTTLYVPYNCIATATLSVNASGFVYVYIMGLYNTIYNQVNNYSISLGLPPPYNISYYYQFNGTYINQIITLEPNYAGGDYYFVFVDNEGTSPVYAIADIYLDNLSCYIS
ncbi:hypothetical protein YN1_5580 [Nanoarchaeota archaeon]